MKRKLSLIAGCVLLSGSLCAQTGWLPPATLTGSACDPSPWKLVLYDDFDGTAINTAKWNTYVSWDGMSRVVGGTTIYGDHSDWGGARTCNANALFKDANVVVSGGTCKLLMRNEKYSWKCPSCPTTETRNLTTSMIATPYHLTPNGAANYYNSGRFEAKIKFPIFKGAWCAFWLWHGGNVNEIDIAEAWGGGTWPYFGERRRNTSNLHAWKPNPNPYSLPDHAPGPGIQFPNQSYWDFFFNKSDRHRQEDWHVYASEWDTACIKTYLDFSLVNTVWKYYRNETVTRGFWPFRRTYTYQVGSGCNPNGQYKVTYGYPHNSINSESHLRLGTGFTDDQHGDANSNYTIGQMEVDYVKAWQRHPAQDGHTDLCSYSGPIPSLSGSNMICSDQTFTVSNPVAGATWTYSNNLSIVSTTANSCTFHNNSPVPYTNGFVRYNYGSNVAGCPQRYVQKAVSCPLQKANPYLIVEMDVSSGRGRYLQLFEATHFPEYEESTDVKPTFTWDLEFNSPALGTQRMTTSGQYISTPVYNLAANDPYTLKWTLTVKEQNGNITVKKGFRNELTPVYQQPDTTVYYIDAFVPDMDQYEQTVADRVEQTMVDEKYATDTDYMNNLIERISITELEPYLIAPRTASKEAAAISTELKSDTRIYPNPVSNIMTVIPGSGFTTEKDIVFNISDIMGKLVRSETVRFVKGSIVSLNLGTLPDNTYIIEIKQNGMTEHHKVIKTAK